MTWKWIKSNTLWLCVNVFYFRNVLNYGSIEEFYKNKLFQYYRYYSKFNVCLSLQHSVVDPFPLVEPLHQLNTIKTLFLQDRLLFCVWEKCKVKTKRKTWVEVNVYGFKLFDSVWGFVPCSHWFHSSTGLHPEQPGSAKQGFLNVYHGD